MADRPNGSELSDRALMVRAQAGDTEAFAALYDRHSTWAYRVAYAVCHESGRAEDAVQEGFLSIWRGRAKYRPEGGSFQAWSMRIVQNRAIDSSRRAAVRPRLQREDANGELPDALTPSIQDDLIARSESRTLAASLEMLPEAQAEVITLAFFGELTQSEIATQLAIPKGTVKGRMRLGLEKLRYELATAEH